MKGKKILWVSPWFGNYRVPVYDQINKLSDNRFYLICAEDATSELVRNKLKTVLRENVSILQNCKHFFIGNKSTTFANMCIEIKWQPGLYREIKKINPDVIIVEGFGSWSPAGVLYSILHRKKLCMFYERTSYVERNAKWISIIYRKIIGKFVDCFLVNGKLTEEYLQKGLGFSKTAIRKGCMAADSKGLYDAVSSVTKEQIINYKEKMHLKEGLTYLFVGQLVKRKGVVELLNAWNTHISTYPYDNLIIVGKGILQDELQEKNKNISSVHILGGIDYSLIHLYYALADVFFMPTLEDNWCLVLPEAMACGLPVACSIYNGGTCELIKNGENGFSFDPLNQESIIQTLSVFHKCDLKKMGEESIHIESLFSPEISANNIYTACNEN
ncbi:MAG: glycosyltransferase family 4 protein [Paludibacteraceae bacterium]|nr:glycosyltransferase family 4 protein [Paludibacteraceae bacterium]